MIIFGRPGVGTVFTKEIYYELYICIYVRFYYQSQIKNLSKTFNRKQFIIFLPTYQLQLRYIIAYIKNSSMLFRREGKSIPLCRKNMEVNKLNFICEPFLLSLTYKKRKYCFWVKFSKWRF